MCKETPAEVLNGASVVVELNTISVCEQAVRGLLDNPNEPVNELSYFDCIESVMENSKVQAFKTNGRTVCFNCQGCFTQAAAEDLICTHSLYFRAPQVLGESMAGISQHCKTGDVVAFGDSVGLASKALCGLTEAAGQVRSQHCT